MPEFKRLYYIPLLLLLVPGVTICITYTLTETLHHFPVGKVPFISSTGCQPPERFFFTYGMGSTAFLFLVLALIRHGLITNKIKEEQARHLSAETGIDNSPSLITLNKRTTYIAIGTAFSLLGVASVQYTAGKIPHLIFAASFFTLGNLYTTLCTRLSYRLKDVTEGMQKFRLIINIVSWCCFVACCVTQMYKSEKSVAALFEVLTTCGFMGYFFTMIPEMKEIRMRVDLGPLDSPFGTEGPPQGYIEEDNEIKPANVHSKLLGKQNISSYGS